MAEDPKGTAPESSGADGAGAEACRLLADWREWLGEGISQVETFTKERPGTGLALSFAAGFLVSALLRRK